MAIRQDQVVRLANALNGISGRYGSFPNAELVASAYLAQNGSHPGVSKFLAENDLSLILEDPTLSSIAATVAQQHNLQYPTNTSGRQYRRGWGAFKEGFLAPFETATGYLDPRVPTLPTGDTFKVETIGQYGKGARNPGAEKKTVNTYEVYDGKRRQNYAKEFYDINISDAGYSPLEAALFRAGAMAGNVWSNAIRSKYWQAHPADVGNKLGINFTLGPPTEGFPQPERYLKTNGTKRFFVDVPGTKEAAALGALGGFLGVEALYAGSGNYDPLNWAEGGRAEGYAALSAEEGGDQRKPTSAVGDVLQRHVLGRKGRILPWEQFRLERPDVSYENYQRYKDWQWGKTDDDLLNDATFGVAKFTPHGLDGQTPELNVMGVSVTPMGAAAALGTVLAARQAHKYLGRRAFDEYADLANLVGQRELIADEAAKFYGEHAHNPFARAANRSPIRRAQYAKEITERTGRYAHHADPNNPI